MSAENSSSQKKIRENGGVGWIWRRFDQEPIFDILVADTDYIKIMDTWGQLIVDQRNTVRSRLVVSH